MFCLAPGRRSKVDAFADAVRSLDSLCFYLVLPRMAGKNHGARTANRRYAFNDNLPLN